MESFPQRTREGDHKNYHFYKGDICDIDLRTENILLV